MSNLIESAASHWAAMAEFRSNRERAKRYCYGRQWDDLINVNGVNIKEEDYIRSQGNVPLKNNLIRRLVRSVLGVFRNQYEFPSVSALHLDENSEADARLYQRLLLNADHNRLLEIHARTMEEFLISGLAVHRKSAVADSSNYPFAGFLRTDYVSPEAFFVDAAARDFRGWDVRIVGQTHDLSLNSLCAAMATNRAEARRLREIYADCDLHGLMAEYEQFGEMSVSALRNFLSPSAPGLCRVIEVWTRSAVERYRVHDVVRGCVYKIEAADYPALASNPDLRFSWMMDNVWHFHFLAPDGTVLREGISPLPDGGHPYVWKGYPFIDGEIHSFVSDVIDQQRHTNRLITLYDWVLRSTAKGVLLFPESALPDGVEIDDISDQWSRFNGVILFRPKAGMPLPQQVTGNASKVGITDLLNIQLTMFEDVSGVSGALEGKLSSGAVSGKLYDQQTRQALIALQDILETYNSFIREGALLDARLLRNP